MVNHAPSEANPPPIGPDAAVFLDFDGTLAAIQDDPETVALKPGGADVLAALSGRVAGALAILSGRDIRDLARRVPAALWRIGGHGLDVRAPGEAAGAPEAAPPAPLAAEVDAIAAAFPGTRVERKGPILALHYRAAPEAGPALVDALANALGRAIAAHPGYRLQHGKMVFEAKPDGAHKGRAIAALMTRAPFAGRTPIMVGDDRTDEDAFATVRACGGSAVKVGAGESAAAYRLASPEAVWRWLETT